MSAAATQAPIRATGARRRAPRHQIAIPVDVTALRSGVPYRIPGRSVNLSEGGLALVLAGQLRLGDSVGLELGLPDSGAPILLKAVVRHQAFLFCGLEFLGLSEEQRTRIRICAQGKSGVSARDELSVVTAQGSETAVMHHTPSQALPPSPRHAPVSVRVLYVALAAFIAIGAVGWWQWYRAWKALDSLVPRSESGLQPPRVSVPANVMEALVTHKVEPVYPEAARRANIQGLVILQAVIGADGTVVDLDPISGPDALTSAAVEAVKSWHFQPYQVDGKPVEVETTVAVNFRDN